VPQEVDTSEAPDPARRLRKSFVALGDPLNRLVPPIVGQTLHEAVKVKVGPITV
jgi:hypothetical protein